MKPLLGIAAIFFMACGNNANISHRDTADSIAKRPAASPREQDPGTPGPAGTDSTRPGATSKKTPSDSSR